MTKRFQFIVNPGILLHPKGRTFSLLSAPSLAPSMPSTNDIPMIAFLETFSELFYERIGLLVVLLIIGLSALSPSFRGLLRLKS